ncbi:MAG: hypothetical protein R3D85_11545 [Paracoccaceae bacterium]
MPFHKFAGLTALSLAAIGTSAGGLQTFSSGVFIYDSTLSEADLNVSDDAVIGGNLCVGQHCAQDETFAISSVVKLLGLAPGIEFKETINPSADARWWIGSDYLGYGGIDRFSIGDLATDTIPFTVEQGAPDSALWVALDGHIGFGTFMPAAHLHVLDGVQPSLRLEQDGSGGHDPAAWEAMTRAADGAFALRDPLAGLTALSIAQGSESNALVLANDSVGIGVSTALPRAKLHIDLDSTDATYPYGLLLGDGLESGLRPDLPGAMAHIVSHSGNASLKIDEQDGTTSPRTLLEMKNNGRPEIVMANTDTGGEWSFGAGTNFVLKQGAVGSASNAKTKLFEIDDRGNATLAGTLITGGTTCGTGCDRVFSQDYTLPSVAEHASAMFARGHLPNLGPTPEGTPFNVSEKLGGVINELEHAHIYIARQQGEIDAQRGEIAALRQDLAALRQALGQADRAGPGR